MKKIKYILLLIIMLTWTTITKATQIEKGPFFYEWSNEYQNILFEEQIEYGDNIGYKDGTVIIKAEIDDAPYILLERYNTNGEVIKSNTIGKETSSAFTSVITDDDYLYAVIEMYDDETDERTAKLIKIDENMKVVAELNFEEGITPGVDGMINARRYGHDILALDQDYLYIYCGEEYMLKTKKDLSEWEPFEYTYELSKKYFPDLTKTYDLVYEWSQEANNGNYQIDYFVTTHTYKDYYLTSGMSLKEDYPVAVFKLFDYDNKEIVSVYNPDYSKFIQARVIKNHIVAIALVFDNNFEVESSDIVIYDMEGNLLKSISNDGIYHMLNETKSGFVVTNVTPHPTCSREESSAPKANSTFQSNAQNSSNSLYEAIINADRTKDYVGACMLYKNESYYLQLNVETKVTGEGTVEVVEETKAGEEVSFKVQPKDGYKLEKVIVTDAEGKQVVFTDYKFTMPSNNVTIEAIFIVDNPNTVDVSLLSAIILGFLSILYLCINKNNKLTKIKEYE